MKVGDYVMARWSYEITYSGQIIERNTRGIPPPPCDLKRFTVQLFGINYCRYVFNENELTVISDEEAMLRKLES
jgi:hypothetical protein